MQDSRFLGEGPCQLSRQRLRSFANSTKMVGELYHGDMNGRWIYGSRCQLRVGYYPKLHVMGNSRHNYTPDMVRTTLSALKDADVLETMTASQLTSQMSIEKGKSHKDHEAEVVAEHQCQAVFGVHEPPASSADRKAGEGCQAQAKVVIPEPSDICKTTVRCWGNKLLPISHRHRKNVPRSMARLRRKLCSARLWQLRSC